MFITFHWLPVHQRKKNSKMMVSCRVLLLLLSCYLPVILSDPIKCFYADQNFSSPEIVDVDIKEKKTNLCKYGCETIMLYTTPMKFTIRNDCQKQKYPDNNKEIPEANIFTLRCITELCNGNNLGNFVSFYIFLYAFYPSFIAQKVS